jgi:LCP family protein required for cell wall assembly
VDGEGVSVGRDGASDAAGGALAGGALAGGALAGGALAGGARAGGALAGGALAGGALAGGARAAGVRGRPTVTPASRRGALWRFAAGALVVVLFTATTTAVAGLLQFKQIAHELSATPAIKSPQVTIADPGNPQTLLLIGSDHRAGEPWRAANTDTMLLVHIDPSSTTINLLSLPRDLKVDVPGFGIQKLNAAYSLGGPNLLLETIRANVFPDLHVNHIIDVNFKGFSDLVDAIGCVYADVDHRYYNNTATDDYASIDIEPGYQKLCGEDQSPHGALAFVRFRHLDSDIVRNARQQDFLRWAKDQFSTATLIAQRDKLLTIFGRNTQTDADLHTADGVENLFNLVAFSAGHTIKNVPFPAILLPCPPPPPNAPSAVQQTPCYVTADPAAEQRAYEELMAPTLSTPAPAIPNGAATGPRPRSGPQPTPGLVADLADGEAQAAALGHLGMPVYAPRQILAGSQYCTPNTRACPVEDGQAPAQVGIDSGYPRAYLIHDQSGQPHVAYRLTLVISSPLGEYYGIQGTTWQDPPILNDPTRTVFVGGKQLLEYFNGGRLSLVAWRTPAGVYWVSNTLTDTIGNAQMVAIAASLTRVG